MRILLLGGTTEARALAGLLVDAGIDSVFSYAGRTITPIEQVLPTRIGGFGGVEGLIDYLHTESITHLVDATHPFAVQISQHAQQATDQSGVALVTLQRAAWKPTANDHWLEVSSLQEAAAALPAKPSRVFLAIGRQTIDQFAGQPQHHYLLRFVDPPQEVLPLPDTKVVVARGPYHVADDLAMIKAHAIDVIVAKNSGGTGGEAKLIAARELGLPVIMVARPPANGAMVLSAPNAVVEYLQNQ